MDRDLVGIFKEKLTRYSIRRNEVAAAIGKSPGQVSDILNGHVNPMMATFMTFLDAVDELHPGFAGEYWQMVVGRQTVGQFVSSLDSIELGVLLTLVGKHLRAPRKIGVLIENSPLCWGHFSQQGN